MYKQCIDADFCVDVTSWVLLWSRSFLLLEVKVRWQVIVQWQQKKLWVIN